jgi:hypothetical protein
MIVQQLLPIIQITLYSRTTFSLLFPIPPHTFKERHALPAHSHKDSFFFHLKVFSVEKKEDGAFVVLL